MGFSKALLFTQTDRQSDKQTDVQTDGQTIKRTSGLASDGKGCFGNVIG